MNGLEDPTTGKAVTTDHPHPHASAPPANETNHSPASITPSSGANARRQPNELEGPWVPHVGRKLLGEFSPGTRFCALEPEGLAWRTLRTLRVLGGGDCFAQTIRSANHQQLPTSGRFISRQQIHVQPHRPRDPRWQLPEERVPGIDIGPLPILCPQQPALQTPLSRIVRRQQRRVVVIPALHEVQPTLLHPTIKIALGNLIR